MMKRVKFLVLCAAVCLSSQAYAIKFARTPYLQNISQTEAVFVWETDAESVGWVEIAPDDGSHFYSTERPKYHHTVAGIKAISRLHSVKVEGLEPGTTYRYRVLSREVLDRKGYKVKYGDVCSQNVFKKLPESFTTLDSRKASTSFAILNDIHGNAERIEPLLKNADYENKDLIFFNGDMVSSVGSVDVLFDGFMNEAVRLFATRKSPYYVRGNHETRGEAATAFHSYFNPCQPYLYYTLRQGPVLFICLDCGEDKPDSSVEYSDLADFDRYRTEEAEWLKGVAESEEFKSAEYRVVVSHMHHGLDADEWHGLLDCTRKFSPTLNTMGIDVLLAGHTHKNEFYEASEAVNYPVLINSNTSCISAVADGEALVVSIIGKDGEQIMKKRFTPKRGKLE